MPTLQQKELRELKINPMSIAIYGENEDVSDLVSSMKEVGQITPLTIKPDGTIISGHRRYKAAQQAGLTFLNVVVVTPIDEVEEELLIISANKQREKTASQVMNEIVRLEALYKIEGRRRQSESATRANQARARKSQPIPAEGHEIIPKSSEPPFNRRKIIAKELGISTSQVHYLKTIRAAVDMGAPEAKSALARLDRGAITLFRAYEITRNATNPKLAKPIQWDDGEIIEPELARDLVKAAGKVNAYLTTLAIETGKEAIKISPEVARRLTEYLCWHIHLCETVAMKLQAHIEKVNATNR